MKTVIAFTVGAAIGAAISWQYCKGKYEAYIQDEIDQVKEYYANKTPKNEEPEDTCESKETYIVEKQTEKPDIAEYAKRLSEEGYIGYDQYSEKNKNETGSKERPYVISPEEFGEVGYNQISLMYYADGVLTDDEDVPVDNIDDIVGADFADHFGEYEDDSVFVRNDPRKCDYEILRSLKTYKEIIAENPCKAGV